MLRNTRHQDESDLYAPVSVVRVLVPKAASQRESLAHLIG
jgi:hypothetical protein